MESTMRQTDNRADQLSVETRDLKCGIGVHLSSRLSVLIGGFCLTHGARSRNNSQLAFGATGSRDELAYMKKNIEIEVKLACDDLSRLTRAGFELHLHKP